MIYTNEILLSLWLNFKAKIRRCLTPQRHDLIYSQPCQRLEVLDPLRVDLRDLVDVQVELRGLLGDALGHRLEVGVAAADDGAGASAGRRAVVLAQTAQIVVV